MPAVPTVGRAAAMDRSGPATPQNRCYPRPVADLQRRLTEDHQQLERLVTALTTASERGESATQRELAAEFECQLLAHFEGEEKFLFPLLVREFPEEVTALREEHELIRRQVATMVTADEERRVAPAVAARLVTTLQRHARREDAMLYAMVNDSATSARYRELIGYLAETYDRLRAVEDEA